MAGSQLVSSQWPSFMGDWQKEWSGRERRKTASVTSSTHISKHCSRKSFEVWNPTSFPWFAIQSIVIDEKKFHFYLLGVLLITIFNLAIKHTVIGNKAFLNIQSFMSRTPSGRPRGRRHVWCHLNILSISSDKIRQNARKVFLEEPNPEWFMLQYHCETSSMNSSTDSIWLCLERFIVKESQRKGFS